MAAPHIVLYTNHRCPYAHRAHIALLELGLPYEEVIIDLDKPREPWYLKVNPVRHAPTQEIPIDYHDVSLTTSPVYSAGWSPQSSTPTPT